MKRQPSTLSFAPWRIQGLFADQPKHKPGLFLIIYICRLIYNAGVNLKERLGLTSLWVVHLPLQVSICLCNVLFFYALWNFQPINLDFWILLSFWSSNSIFGKLHSAGIEEKNGKRLRQSDSKVH